MNLGTVHSTDIRFATVSAITGLSFLDDGRAHASVDWDYDGDVDIWSTNRTAPRLRFLRNGANGNHHFLAIRLHGRQCNRDAIGARVEVVSRKGQDARPLVRSLRAGEGFLAQSSKWLQFGLADEPAVDSVVIHWPGGEPQTLRGLEADSFYDVVQGQMPVRRDPSSGKLHRQKDSEPWVEPSSSGPTQILLSSRFALPHLPLRRFDGTEERLDDVEGGAIWLNLWASWCTPCLKELQEAGDRVDELRAAGVAVVALSLDGMEQPGAQVTSIDDARQWADGHELPFVTAAATPETIRRLQFVESVIFGRESEMVLPASYLLTDDGQLAAIYRGPVPVDKVLDHAAHLADDDPSLLESALPFPGIWFDGRRRPAPIAIVADLLDHRAFDDALDYVQHNRQELARQRGYVEVIGQLGTSLARRNRAPPALQLYRWALDVDPDNVPVLNNLAWHLATHADPSVRDPKTAIGHAESAARLTQYGSVAILDTLATCYAAAQQLDLAEKTLEQAIGLAQESGQLDSAMRLEAKLAKLRTGL